MAFDKALGDELFEDVDADLADQMRDVFLKSYLAGDRTSRDQIGEPRIVIYKRPDKHELRIDGPEVDQEWCSPPWSGDVRDALVFAEDAGFAAMPLGNPDDGSDTETEVPQ